MSHRFSLHAAEVSLAGQVTPNAPAGTAAHAAIVIRPIRNPRDRAGVARLAIHSSAVKQLGFWNVVGRLGQGARRTLRQIVAAVAGLASRCRDHRVVHRRRQPSGHLVAGIACVAGGRNMCRQVLACRANAMAGSAGASDDTRVVE